MLLPTFIVRFDRGGGGGKGEGKGGSFFFFLFGRSMFLFDCFFIVVHLFHSPTIFLLSLFFLPFLAKNKKKTKK